MRRSWAFGGSLLLAAVAAGCSTPATLVNHPTGASGTTVAHVGDTLDLLTASGHHFSITEKQLVDPAHGTGHTAPSHGRRFLAALFQVTNASTQTVAGDGNADANLVGKNGNIYLPALVSLSECGKSTSQYQLGAGKSTTICVAFEVSKTVGIASVQFYPAAGAASRYGEWLVP